MRIFLDSSVVISACGSERSLSRLIFEIAAERGWFLVSAAYCRAETVKNLTKIPLAASKCWKDYQHRIEWLPNALTTRRPLLLTASKEKPVLVSALAAECETFLTLDRGDFSLLLGTEVYRMLVTTPRDFLISAGLG